MTPSLLRSQYDVVPVFMVLLRFFKVAHQARTPVGGHFQPGDGVLAQRVAEEQTLRDFSRRGGVRQPASTNQE